jgi:hypothetical protein
MGKTFRRDSDYYPKKGRDNNEVNKKVKKKDNKRRGKKSYADNEYSSFDSFMDDDEWTTTTRI